MGCKRRLRCCEYVASGQILRMRTAGRPRSINDRNLPSKLFVGLALGCLLLLKGSRLFSSLRDAFGPL